MDKKNFYNIVIIILCIFIVIHKSFNTKIILGLFVAGIIIFYKYSVYDNKTIISPNHASLEFIKDDELTQFLNNIEDIYMYNPYEFEKLLKSINKFYELYELSFIDEKTANSNFELMEEEKRKGLNILSSIILNTDNQYIRNKINVSSENLNTIMTKHLDQISYLSDNDIYKNGYNNNTKIIDYDITKPYNIYNDIFEKYSYELF
jgi:hypothetical protein